MAARERSKAKSLDRRHYESHEKHEGREKRSGRAQSDSRASRRQLRNDTLPPIESAPHSQVTIGTTIQQIGPCGPGPDIYANVLGPTADETILVGLQLIRKMGFAESSSSGEGEVRSETGTVQVSYHLRPSLKDTASRKTISSEPSPTHKEPTIVDLTSSEPPSKDDDEFLVDDIRDESSQTEYSTAMTESALARDSVSDAGSQTASELSALAHAQSQTETELKNVVAATDSLAPIDDAKRSSEESVNESEDLPDENQHPESLSGQSDKERDDRSKSHSSSSSREKSDTLSKASFESAKSKKSSRSTISKKSSESSKGDSKIEETSPDEISEKSKLQLNKSQKSILKESSSSSKSEKETSGSISCTCTCSVRTGQDKESSEQDTSEQNRKSVCFCCSCSGDKRAICSIRRCPERTKENIYSKCCSCNTSCVRITETDPGTNMKLGCDCYTSTSSAASEARIVEDMTEFQKGDGNQTEGKIKYSITKITDFGKFTTYEVMKSTRRKPKYMPVGLEGVFVLRRSQD